jgi:CheY-like chemotaxis protein
LPEQKRVLLIEDDLDVQAILRYALEVEGYQVDYAANGQEALEALAQTSPDLILLGLIMPVMDGLSFLRARQARALCPTVPALVITGYPDGLQNGEQLGVAGVIRKPFDLDDLLGRIAELTGVAA